MHQQQPAAWPAGHEFRRILERLDMDRTVGKTMRNHGTPAKITIDKKYVIGLIQGTSPEIHG